MAVANRVREIRKIKNTTQKLLAKEIGVDPRTIKNIEAGDTCSLEVALRLAKYFELNVESIFSVEDIR